MHDVAKHAPTYRFGVFEFDSSSAELRKNGILIKLQVQPAQILALLLEQAGQIVSRDQVQICLWPDNTFVNFDNAINTAVRKLREALGDSAVNPRFVETVARRGYRFVAPVSSGLDQPPEAPTQPAPPATPRSRRPITIAVIAAAGLVLLIATFLITSRRPAAPAEMHVTPLTSNTGLELEPSFSPDGTRIAYTWAVPEQHRFAVYVKLKGPGDPLAMTRDNRRIYSPAWSPDGRWIAALRDFGPEASVVLIPASGGQFKEVARVVKAAASAETCLHSDYAFVCGVPFWGSELAWSRDSRYLYTSAQVSSGSVQRIVRISVESGDTVPVTSPPAEIAGDFGASVSPDSGELAFIRLNGIKTGDLYVMPLSDGLPAPAAKVRRITADAADIMTPAWSADGRELIFSSDRRGRRQLWRVSAKGGSPVRLVGIGEDALDVAISPSGSTFVYNRGIDSGSLWKIPISADKGGEPVRVTETTARDKYSQFSPDGNRIAFQSARSGVSEIWVCDASGANAVQLTTFGKGMSGSPRWSPDGSMIAFDSDAEGDWSIYLVRSTGGQPKRVTAGVIPSWSRDGNSIYFMSQKAGRADVWKVRVDGSSEVQITTGGGLTAIESTDGKYIYVKRGDENSGDIYRMGMDGSNPIKVLGAVRGRLFTVFDNSIYFAAGTPRAQLRRLDLTSGSIHVIAPIPGAPHADISPDRRWALYPKLRRSDTNLMVVENFQ